MNSPLSHPTKLQITQLPPLSLYIHIPWCVQKCPYCDFNSHTIKQGIPEQQYLQALITDLEQELPDVWGRRVQTIFIGGGTPSTFSPDAINEIINSIRARIPLSPNAEITMEANPGTLDNSRLKGFFEAGINRLSVGVQSFDDGLLKNIGRIHDAKQATAAIESAHKAGFENINLDLMFALPGQTPQLAKKDVQTAVSLNPHHISYYHLTLEPNTWFYTNPPTLPEEDDVWDIQESGQALLAEHGYMQYETSAYAKQGHQCRHNINYWQFGDYIGIGAGAHGKVTRADTQTIQRRWKEKHPATYIEDLLNQRGATKTQILETRELTFEFLMNALRLENGFDIDLFTKHTGLGIQHLKNSLQTAQSQGMIDINNDTGIACPTNKGKLFLNDLLMSLMDDQK